MNNTSQPPPIQIGAYYFDCKEQATTRRSDDA